MDIPYKNNKEKDASIKEMADCKLSKRYNHAHREYIFILSDSVLQLIA